MRFLWCRIFGHVWKIYRISREDNIQWKLCERCLTGGGFKLYDDRQFAEWQIKRAYLYDD